MELGDFLGALAAIRASKTITFAPPIPVARAATKGLLYRRKFKRGGTPVGIARAVQLMNRRAVSLNTIGRMYSYFSRHAVDRRPGWDDPRRPSNGYIAWLLWGGDVGRVWATRIWERFKNR
jgi:hypothetical protein